MTDDSDERLLSLSGEDPEAFRVLYRRHAESILGFLRRATPDADTAVELLAETMALAYERRAQHDPDRGSVRGWLYGIARHELQRYWRHRRTELNAVRRLSVMVPRVDEQSAERIDAMVDAEQRRPDLSRELDRLSPAEREAVLMRVVDDLDYSEIADQLECSPGAARVRVHRGLARLKTHLEATK